MKYAVVVVREKPNSSNFNAWSKAPADVLKTLQGVGISIKYIIAPGYRFPLFNYFFAFFYILKIYFQAKSEDEVYLQSFDGYMNLVSKLLKKKGAYLFYIVHDILRLRFGDIPYAMEEWNYLKRMDRMFVHTDNMVMKLRSMGLNCEMRVMRLFDYYSDDDMMDKEEQMNLKNTLCFAGNLDKSAFLEPMLDVEFPDDFELRLFGVKNSLDISKNSRVKYMGKFEPSKTSSVKAGWGLLWDGNDISTCSGSLGEYLKLNSSHKISLYLTCGIPLIVWSKCALSSWLQQEGVCITIDNLLEIPEKLSHISESEYREYVENSRKIGSRLRKGLFLSSILN